MRRVLRTLLIINRFLLVLPVLAFFMLFGMVAAFISPFTIENQTAEPIRVTPLGSIPGVDERFPLPLYDRRSPAFHARRLTHFDLAPGQARAFLYDMDDIQFTEILVEAGGRLLQLRVSDPPNGSAFTSPAQERFVITDLDRLEPAAPSVAVFASREAVTFPAGAILLTLLAPLPTWVVLEALSSWYRRP